MTDLLEGLHTLGNRDLISQGKIISVVGSRKASPSGKVIATVLGGILASQGYTLMSGLAEGIDTCVFHGASVISVSKLIGVIGTPLSESYPVSNQKLQAYVGSKHLLISPFEEGNAPGRAGFPIRNEVMAKLSHLTIVVEAEENSGTHRMISSCLKHNKPLVYLGKDPQPWIQKVGAVCTDLHSLVSGEMLEDLMKPRTLPFFVPKIT